MMVETEMRASKMPVETENPVIEVQDDVVDLVKRAREGDPDAFRDCINRYADQVYRIAYRIVGNADDARDIAQEVFIKLHGSLKSFDQEFLFSTWLYRITVNASIDFRRKESHHQQETLTEINQSAIDTRTTDRPDSNVEREEIRGAIGKLMNGLSDQQCRVFVLRDLQGFTCDEIATILDCTTSTVRVHLAAARAAMRKQISKKYPEWSGGD
jgi:RNA polymerase sigma-70 factor (ECF subfamily)